MKRKIVTALLILFVFFVTGATLATYIITNTTNTLSRLVTLHQIEDLRQHLIISIQTVQSDLYTVHTLLSNKVDTIADNVSKLEATANECNGCHHEPAVTQDLQEVVGLIAAYQESLSYYITASANRQRIEKLQLEAAELGNVLLAKTGAMSFNATRKLKSSTELARSKINQARFVLYLTVGLTFILGAMVAIYLIRAVTGPIEQLVTATRAITKGDLSSTLRTDDKTEFGELATNFNAMSLSLQKNYELLVQEIFDRKQVEDALKESEERYALAARGANDGLWDLDIRSNTIYYSDRWKSMLGYNDDEIGCSLAEWYGLIYDKDREQVEAKFEAHIDGKTPQFECEYRIRHKDNSIMWVLVRGLAVRDEKGTAYRLAGSQTDITARKSAEEQLAHDAFHDALTELPNRALFLDRLAHVIERAQRNNAFFYAVLFADLDRFKVINDSMGHGVGDLLLIEVGRRLKSCLRPGDTVARIGGDEFAILLEDIVDRADTVDIIRRIEESLKMPFHYHGQEFFTSSSIGVALKSERYERPDEVLRDADVAMYEAKSKGGARHEFFDATMHSNIIERNQLEGELRSAMEHHDGFVLHYQPIINLKTHLLNGFEALVRWNHQSRGLIYPNDFIPLAEETGVIIPLSKWIIKEACRQLRIWQDMYRMDSPLMMSVNISSKLLIWPGFVESVASCLQEEGLPPESLALEITESLILEHTEIVLEALTELKKMGVHIHIDDFGTGYSSLSYLHNFPVTALKIDQSFIANLSATNDNQEIIKTIIALAQNLNLEVIAEGVELNHQLLTIRGLDCNYGQGFLFSKALAPDAIQAWIKSNSAHMA